MREDPPYVHRFGILIKFLIEIGRTLQLLVAYPPPSTAKDAKSDFITMFGVFCVFAYPTDHILQKDFGFS
jgi:hypothetical protein